MYGVNTVSGLVADASDTPIQNCMVSGEIRGLWHVGGIVAFQARHEIANCCFIGTITARHDIKTTNHIPQYFGGICGITYENSILNCYLVCEVPSETNYTGILGADGNDGLLISNCYYKNYDSGLPIARETIPTVNVSAFDGSGTSWSLTDPIYADDAFRYDLLEVLNIWVDANNADNTYSHWTADTENRNDGFPVLLADNAILGIERVQASDQPFEVYSIAGQKVASQVTTLKQLPRGIYIVNGRKVVVK